MGSAVGAEGIDAGRVAALHREAASVHHPIELPLAVFAEAVAAATEAGAPTIEANDLYLALACLAGDGRALAVFERDVMAAVVPSVVRACKDSDTSPEDVVQATREKLLVSDEPKLAQYLGRGSLVGWVRVVAVREALQDRRRSRRRRARDDADLFANEESPSVDVELLRRRFGAAFRLAVKEALARLTAEQRTLLRLHTHEGLTIDQLAPLLGVHRATAARRLERARADALAHTRALLRESQGLSESEARSLVVVLGREIDVSIGSALAEHRGA